MDGGAGDRSRRGAGRRRRRTWRKALRGLRGVPLDRARRKRRGADPLRHLRPQGRRARRLPLSPALKRSGIIWTEGTLDTFIADSQATVPANRMPYAGMPNAADRGDLIAYLQKASK
jgi:hypothetical protein